MRYNSNKIELTTMYNDWTKPLTIVRINVSMKPSETRFKAHPNEFALTSRSTSHSSGETGLNVIP